MTAQTSDKAKHNHMSKENILKILHHFRYFRAQSFFHAECRVRWIREDYVKAAFIEINFLYTPMYISGGLLRYFSSSYNSIYLACQMYFQQLLTINFPSITPRNPDSQSGYSKGD